MREDEPIRLQPLTTELYEDAAAMVNDKNGYGNDFYIYPATMRWSLRRMVMSLAMISTVQH